MKADEYVVQKLIEAENMIAQDTEMIQSLRAEIVDLQDKLDYVRQFISLELIRRSEDSKTFAITLPSQWQCYEPDAYAKLKEIFDLQYIEDTLAVGDDSE